MILIDRSKFPEPDVLRAMGSKLTEQAAEFFRTPKNKRTQDRWNFRIRPLRGLKDSLLELSHGKCAYCESTVEVTGVADIDNFRPRVGAVNLRGDRDPDHYWWLAYEWRNLYPACAECNRNKGQRFPVVGRRAPLETPWERLEVERGLLLDPGLDDPERHLLFFEDGRVAAVAFQDLPGQERKRFGKPTRGQVTIDTFGLNRPQLSAERARHAKSFTLFLDAARSAHVGRSTIHLGQSLNDLRENLEPHQPYLALKRQLLSRWLENQQPSLVEQVLEELQAVLPQAEPVAPAAVEIRQRAAVQQQAWEETVQVASAERGADKRAYYARANYIERVALHNVASLQHLEFDFQGDSGAAAPWLMLLGENGTGKTSILKAITMALIGPARLAELIKSDPNQQSIFHRGGYVRAFLSSSEQPLEVRLVKGRLQHNHAPEGAKVILRAFGPSRWFPTPGATDPETRTTARVRNLFNPFVPLADPERYLSSRNNREWSETAKALKDLLGLKRGDRLYRRQGKLQLKLRGLPAEGLRRLSSGYEALIAVAVDLMQLLAERWPDLRSAEGICLLDEIGAHLHPTMKMQIVTSLRRTFPRVQFIASTHEPLCLRGLGKGEVLVLRREEAGVSSYVPEQSPAELRVDQLLTSRMFGLHSTLDPELEEQFDRYYYLLSRKAEALTSDERQELATLKDSVGKRGILGDSRREQMMYEVIDQFLAVEASLEPEEREEQEKWTKQQAVNFWTSLGQRNGGDP